ncbi:MAG: ABC transporter permease [Ferruginibacter sp.]|nr:ABC transporter permease [Cytophagales bacterium]
MLRNYFTIALRNLWRNKVYGLINIAGLATGMAVSILILLFVAHEFTFDRFHTQSSRIYRVFARLDYGGNPMQMTGMSAQFGPTMKRANPGVVNFVRTREPRRVVVKSDRRHRFFEGKFLFADGTLFSVFSFNLLRGDRSRALNSPLTVVLTERMAQRYFGNEDPIGKTIAYDNQYAFVVTGIAQNPPSNSTIDFDFVGSFSSLATVERGERGIIADDDGIPYTQTHVGAGSYVTYLLLNSPASVSKVERTIPRLVKQSGREADQAQFILDPLLKIHLGHNFGDVSNSKYLYIFLGVALSILVLALINYMSLATARSTQRAKEVGVRKVMGANRWDLATQFYGESVVTSLLAFGLALVLVQGMRPVFYNLLRLRIDADFLYHPVSLLALLGLFLFSGLVAGSYPALLLSRFSPVEVLKGGAGFGKLGAAGREAWVRRAFTVFQFTLSVGLIICSLVVQKQMDHIRNRKLGFNKEQVMMVPLDASMERSYGALKNDIRRQTGITSVAATSSSLFEGYNMYFTKTPQTKEDVAISFMKVDEHYLTTLEVEWKTKPEQMERLYAGNSIVINEAAVKKLKISGPPVGQKLDLGEASEIVGVVKDFNFTPQHQEVEALVLTVVKDTVRMAGGFLLVRLDPEADLPRKIAVIEQLYQRYQPERPFEYSFLDDSFDALYKAEDRLAKMFAAFTGFAVFIACLGLFGLVTFTAETRTKEIGIRKVLGASVSAIVSLLSKDFIKLVMIANVLAWPLAYYAMSRWLENFAYRISMGWWEFALAGGLALVIALLTVGFQAIKAAVANPVKSLRTE